MASVRVFHKSCSLFVAKWKEPIRMGLNGWMHAVEQASPERQAVPWVTVVEKIAAANVATDADLAAVWETGSRHIGYAEWMRNCPVQCCACVESHYHRQTNTRQMDEQDERIYSRLKEEAETNSVRYLLISGRTTMDLRRYNRLPAAGPHSPAVAYTGGSYFCITDITNT